MAAFGPTLHSMTFRPRYVNFTSEHGHFDDTITVNFTVKMTILTAQFDVTSMEKFLCCCVQLGLVNECNVGPKAAIYPYYQISGTVLVLTHKPRVMVRTRQ